MVALPWILGALVGPVLWPALLRLSIDLANWLCLPFGKPSRIAFVVTLLVAYAFFFIMILEILLGLGLIVISGPEIPNPAERQLLGKEVFAASILGAMVHQIFLRVEQIRTRNGNKDAQAKSQ